MADEERLLAENADESVVIEALPEGEKSEDIVIALDEVIEALLDDEESDDTVPAFDVVVELLLGQRDSDELVLVLEAVTEALEESEDNVILPELEVAVAVAFAGTLLAEDKDELTSLLILLELDIVLDIVLAMLLEEEDMFLGGRL